MPWNSFFTYDLGQEYLSAVVSDADLFHHNFASLEDKTKANAEHEVRLRKNITFYSQAVFYTPLISNLFVAILGTKGYLNKENNDVNTALGLAIIFIPVVVSFIVPVLENKKIENMEKLKKKRSPPVDEVVHELIDAEGSHDGSFSI